MKMAATLLRVLDCYPLGGVWGLLYIEGWRRFLVLHSKSFISPSFVGSELDCVSSRSPGGTHRAGQRNPGMGS
jgi:hypothetical protein